MRSSWILFPNSLCPSRDLVALAAIFDRHMAEISSDNHSLKSNEVLGVISSDLEAIGYQVEKSKKSDDLIHMPVLFGEQGSVEKDFNADAYQPDAHIVLEVEAGRAVANNQFLKDLFEACMMVDTEYLCIAVRKQYTAGNVQSQDYERVCTFLRTLFASNRLHLPLRGVMILGY